tara:strand:- start:670 stop:1041 length:372 start_codon:yes stop_codon:yes gene_type:complete
MDRRAKLLEAVCGKDLEGNSARYADATVKLILSDMGKYFVKFWNEEGPGCMVFQPNNSDRSMFWLTLEELNNACEQETGELAETFGTILEAAQKIDPHAGAGYIINDHEGMRYFAIDYNEVSA